MIAKSKCPDLLIHYRYFCLILIGNLILIFSSPKLFAQRSDSLPSEADPYYISLRDKLSVYTYGISKFNQIELRDKRNKHPVQYKPNENLNLGLGFNYRWLGIGAAFNFGLINNDDGVYGKTESFDIQSDIYSKRLLMTVNLQSYKGFYWKNIDRYDSTWSKNDSVPLRPDISTFAFGFNAFYTFNFEEFSFKAVYNNTEWQTKTADSWILGGQVSLYGVSGKGNLIPQQLAGYYPVYDSLMQLNIVNIGSYFGYSYTHVWDQNYFLNWTAILGIGLQGVSAHNDLQEEIFSEFRLAGKSHFRLSFGVNNDENYAGLSFILDSTPVKNQFDSEFVYRYGKIRFFVGTRFEVKKKSRE